MVTKSNWQSIGCGGGGASIVEAIDWILLTEEEIDHSGSVEPFLVEGGDM